MILVWEEFTKARFACDSIGDWRESFWKLSLNLWVHVGEEEFWVIDQQCIDNFTEHAVATKEIRQLQSTCLTWLNFQQKWINFHEIESVNAEETRFHANTSFDIFHDYISVAVAVSRVAEETEDEFILAGDLKARECENKVEFEIVEVCSV